MNACPICDGPLPPKRPSGPEPTYCSTKCRRRAHYLRRKADGRLAASMARRLAAAHAKRQPVPCEVCGTPMLGRVDKRFCSSACCLKGQTRGCSVPDCSRPHRALGLCNPHYRAARRAAGIPEPSVWDDRRRDNYQRRRALKKGAATGEPVLLTSIAERDHWRCHLCGKRVNPTTPWPHSFSASLDHVIPLTKGGEHSPANVRLAHLGCNSAKGNGGGGEQLLLLG